MLAFLIDQGNISPKAKDDVTGLLSCYGVNKILNLDRQTCVADIWERCKANADALLVGSYAELSSLAIRRLTLNTVRLPSCLAVWDGPTQSRLVVARVPTATFNQSWLPSHTKFDDIVHAMRSIDGVTNYTLQQFVSTDALRIGGSFSKAGIRRYFFKHSSGRGAAKLLDEIKFYQMLPPPLRSYYPALLFSEQDKQGVSMGIEYKEYPNLRDLLLNLQIEPAEAVRLISQVLDYEYRQAFCSYRYPTPKEYLHDYHYHRVWRRIKMSSELDPIFNGLFGARWLVINGQKLPNIPAMLLSLEQDKNAGARLDPGGVSPFIHADLHLENILCDLPGKRFWLIDPRGYPSCDIYYDLGKLAHSYNSKYDLLHEGRHEATYALHDGFAVINFSFTSATLTDVYAEVNERMKVVIHKLLEAEENSHDIDLRVAFNEAMHFCSDMPFHIHPGAKPNIAIPIYAIGAQLLAEVLRQLEIDTNACVELQSQSLERLDFKGGQPWRFEG